MNLMDTSLSSSDKIFWPYLATSLCCRPFQLYDEYGSVLSSQPELEGANIYFIAENSKIRFVPAEVSTDSQGTINFSLSISNQRIVRCRATLPELMWGASLPAGFQSAFVGVRNQEHYRELLSKESFLTGIALDLDKSDDTLLTFKLYARDCATEIQMLAHNVVDRTNTEIGSYPKILYIGQSHRIRERVVSHEKIQRALSEVADDKDVYLYFFKFADQRLFINEPPETLDESPINVSLQDIEDEGKVNLIEMALINYFKPKYNTTFVETEIPSNKQVQQLLKANGFTKIFVQVYFDGSFWRFGSDIVAHKQDHVVSFEL